MPEDRLAAALPEHPRVRRALVVNPPRNAAAHWLRPAREPFPGPALHEPLRLRRADPADPAAARRDAAAYERSLRRAARRLGLERPAIITTHPVLAGFGDFGWAGPVTYYAWDDWTASEPHRRWWPVYEQAFARLRARGRAVCAVSDTVLERIAPTGPVGDRCPTASIARSGSRRRALPPGSTTAPARACSTSAASTAGSTSTRCGGSRRHTRAARSRSSASCSSPPTTSRSRRCPTSKSARGSRGASSPAWWRPPTSA